MLPQTTAVTAVSDGLTAATTVPAQFFTGAFLEWAILFFVLAIVAAVLGAGDVAGVSMAIGKWLVIIFVVLAVVALLL
ncbi:hypothetical protein L593_04385 [Salinarchaeum sp. Harcht-Bsk1]|uniref:DUF1328 domain-containing protein n=1 Tax=Salinarchaeum sp. Harcht-Bsk1 TaxID=1333523 RepID=UPI0003423995|nr:DUF1328 family protein [Salinarchaeum sp. Harcht-Bsk1]AGN00828.1 hypothetical protein L593_04385 [Salinarchaeum sp. Harcht-Bsk1]